MSNSESKPRTVAPEMLLFRQRLEMALSAAKKLKGLSQNAVADRAGIDSSAITRLKSETGKDGSSVTLNTVLLLSQATGCSFLWLATGRGPTGLEDATETPKPASSVRPRQN